MKSIAYAPLGLTILAAVTCVAGYFHPRAEEPKGSADLAARNRTPNSIRGEMPESQLSAQPSCAAPARSAGCARRESFEGPAGAEAPSGDKKEIVDKEQLLKGKPYRREAAFSLRVKNAIEVEENLEKSLVGSKGELLDLVLEGEQNGRRGTLTAQVPVENFNAFVKVVRDSGHVLNERISVRKLSLPRKAGPTAAADSEGVDYQELAVVTISFAEEIALQVQEGKGILARSLDNGYAHMLKGTAVIIECLSYLFPFALLFGLLGWLAWTVKKRRETIAPTAPANAKHPLTGCAA